MTPEHKSLFFLGHPVCISDYSFENVFLKIFNLSPGGGEEAWEVLCIHNNGCDGIYDKETNPNTTNMISIFTMQINLMTSY